MIGRLLSKEESNAALVVALSGAVAVLVAMGRGPRRRETVVRSALEPRPPHERAEPRTDAQRGAGFGDRRLRARH